MEVYIQETASSLRQEKEHFLISAKDKKNPLSPDKVKSIIIEDNCTVSTNAIKLAIKNDIPIFFSDGLGNIYGKIWKNGIERNLDIRIRQLKIFKSFYGNVIAKKWIIEKIESQKKHIIKAYKRKNIDYSAEIEKFQRVLKSIELLDNQEENFANIIMGYEGVASNIYYTSIGKVLPEMLDFNKRVNQGASDIYNMTLNYAFGILYSKVNHELSISGLDTKIGILHKNILGKDALLYDFIEPFRIIAWECIYSMFTKKLFNKSFIEEKNIISIEGRRVILKEMHTKLSKKEERSGGKYSYNELIKIKIRELIKEIMENEIYSEL